MTFGKMGTDREARIDYPRMREYRLARAREQMAKAGLGALISFEAWNIRYITGGYVTIPTRWTQGQFIVLPRNGDPHCYITTTFSPYRLREAMPWLKDKIWATQANCTHARNVNDMRWLVNTVCEILAEHGLTNELLGVDGSQSELLLAEAFGQKGVQIVDAKQVMFEARKIKNQDEIECVRMACANAEAALADIVRAIRPGVSECELVGVGMNTLYRLGADETQEFVCSSGPRTNPLWIDYTDRQVRPGDLVVVDINGNSFHGYKSCYYRTFCCGKATQEQKDVYEVARAMMYAGIDAIKAGATTWDVCKNWPDSPTYWGYDKWEDVRGYALGHGIGISLHEVPYMRYVMSKEEPIELQEGMVLALETWYGKKGGKDGVRLEENVVVTKDGYELLTVFPVGELMECWT